MTQGNIAHSVRDKLKNIARKEGRNFQEVVSQYLNEAFLHRLAESQHVDHVVLKGATAYAVWNGGPHRATRDIDLLRLDLSQDATLLIQEACRTKLGDDGVEFDVDGIKVREIRTQGVHHGVNVRVPVQLGPMKEMVSIDVAVGDALGDGAVVVKLPTLLQRTTESYLRTYKPELALSEKLHAIVVLAEDNSRLKDYYDLAHLAKNRQLSGELVTALVRGTFEQRGTEVPEGVPVGLSEDFSEDPLKIQQWRGFLRKAHISADDELSDFRAVVLAARELVVPVLEAAREGQRLEKDWEPGEGWSAAVKGKNQGDEIEVRLDTAEDRFAEYLKAWHELEHSSPDAVKDARLGRGDGAELFAAMRSAETELSVCHAAHGERHGAVVKGRCLSWEAPAENLGEAQARFQQAKAASGNARGARLDGVVAWEKFKRGSAPMAVLDARKSKGASGPAIYQRYRQGIEDCRASMSIHAQALKARVEMQQKAEKTKKYDQGMGH